MSTARVIMTLIGISLILIPVRVLLRFDRKLDYAIYKFSETEALGLRRAKWFYCALGFLVLAYSFALYAQVVAFATLGLSRRALITATVVAVGCAMWGLLLALSAWTDAQAVAAFNTIPNPSPKQMREFSADGATKSMLFLFGLPFSLCYTAVWFVVIRLGRRFGRRLFHA